MIYLPRMCRARGEDEGDDILSLSIKPHDKRQSRDGIKEKHIFFPEHTLLLLIFLASSGSIMTQFGIFQLAAAAVFLLWKSKDFL